MFGKIPHYFINELIHRTSIVNIINNRFQLKQHGKYFRAHCPFHDEKTPSFTVNNEKQFYYCFGCKANGNVIDFLINYDRLSFIESIEELAIINNLKIPYEINNNYNKINKTILFNKNYKKRSLFFSLMENLNNFYKDNLQHKNFFLARNYLNYRGLKNNTISKFSIGYSPPGWNNILRYYNNDPENNKILIESGMLIKNHKGYLYDFFRNRIMFPIRDKHGRIIAFGGRTINNNIPKYLNSAETLIFQKKCQLYGLFELYKHNNRPDQVLIVEGYMDVLMLAQHGINYAVSSLGTYTSIEHIQKIFQITNTIIACYDGDQAGRKAAWHLLKITLPYINDERNLKFIFLPQDEDPDTFIRKKGKVIFEKYINNAISFTKFLFDKIILNIDLTTCEGKAKISSKLIPLISKIPSKSLRFYLYKDLGYKLGILDINYLKKFILNQKKIILKKDKNVKNIITSSILNSRLLRILNALIIQNPKLVTFVTSNFIKVFKKSKITGLSFFLELVNICSNNLNLTTGQLIEFYRGTNFSKTLETLSIWNHMIIDKEIENVFQDSLIKIYKLVCQQYLDYLISRDRIKKLNSNERKEFWVLNQVIMKK